VRCGIVSAYAETNRMARLVLCAASSWHFLGGQGFSPDIRSLQNDLGFSP
jgi:hypothetical protein